MRELCVQRVIWHLRQELRAQLGSGGTGGRLNGALIRGRIHCGSLRVVKKRWRRKERIMKRGIGGHDSSGVVAIINSGLACLE